MGFSAANELVEDEGGWSGEEGEKGSKVAPNRAQAPRARTKQDLGLMIGCRGCDGEVIYRVRCALALRRRCLFSVPMDY